MRPKDMTLEQLDALPEGPVRFRTRLATEEEMKTRFYKRGDTVRIPIMERGMVSVQQPDDIAFAKLSDGIYSFFGQHADGSWYKQRMPL